MYTFYTFRVNDTEVREIQLPYIDEDDVEHLSPPVTMTGHVYKLYVRVLLTLKLDNKWTDDHLSALAEFMINYPEDVDEVTLLAFLHPEFYLEDDEE
jgi:hypothetical protein